MLFRDDITGIELTTSRNRLEAAGITGGIATLMILAAGMQRVKGKIPRREAVIIVGLGWLLSSAFGGLPYMLCPPGLRIITAYL